MAEWHEIPFVIPKVNLISKSAMPKILYITHFENLLHINQIQIFYQEVSEICLF